MRNRARKKVRDEGREIALERIGILFGLADREALAGNKSVADGHIDKALRISLRFNVRLPGIYRRKFCRYCHMHLLPGRSSRTRINSVEKRVEVACLSCGRKMFFPYKNEIKAKRRLKHSKTKKEK